MNNFQDEVKERITSNSKDNALLAASKNFMHESLRTKYSYNFSFLGRPIIQYPQDMIAIQEIIWQVKPDLIIETGIAHGGSLIFSASMLALLDYLDACETGTNINPKTSPRKVLGIDIDIRKHNRKAIETHPLFHKIEMIEGSSIAPTIINDVHKFASNYKRILVCLDSNHTHDHVLAELKAYAPLVSKGSYCCTFDTIVEDVPNEMFPDRPWEPGNNPKTAVKEYQQILQAENVLGNDGKPLNFEVDTNIQNKLLITVAPDGFLQRI